MKKLFGIACYVLLVFSVQAQDSGNRKIYDSLLHRQAMQTDRDTSLVNTWNALAEKFTFERPDSGIYYGAKALALSKQLKYDSAELKAYQTVSLCYLIIGNFNSAVHMSLQGIRRAEESGYQFYQGALLLNLSDVYYYSGNQKASLGVAKRAYTIFANLDHKILENKAFFALAARAVGRYLLLKNPDSSLAYNYKAIDVAESTQSKEFIAACYQSFGELYYSLGQTDSALLYYHRSSALQPSSFRESLVALEIAMVFIKTRQIDSALFYASHSFQNALENRLYILIAESGKVLSQLYESSDAAKAFQYSKIALKYQDSVLYISRMVGFSELTEIDEMQRQEEINAAQKDYRNKIRTYILVAGAVVLLFIILLLYRNVRNKQHAKKEIEKAYDQLKSTQSQLIQSEKMASLGELTAGIAHEIQNPLNFVNNFSEVNDELLEEMNNEPDITEVKAIGNNVKENNAKISLHGKRADAIVKNMLEHSRSGKGEKQLTDINALCDEYLRLAYQSARSKDKDFNCKLETDFDESLGKINIVPQDIGRVLLNLFNNAFYACAERSRSQSNEVNADYQPLVSVSTKHVPPFPGRGAGPKDSDGRGEVLIKVTDNGNGIPDSIKDKIFQPFFTTKPTGSGTGLGLSLSYDIIRAHGGEIKVETNEKQGTVFTITIPET